MVEFFLILGSYLVGSLNFAIIFSRLKGSDIRTKDHAGGSGIFRQYGAFAGLTVAFLDILKGVAVGAACLLLKVPPWAVMLAGVAVVAGHDWPLYFGFQGGGGLSTLFGFLIVIYPLDISLFTAGTFLLALIFWQTPLGRIGRHLGNPIPAAAVFGILALFVFFLVRYGFLYAGCTVLILGLMMGIRRLTVRLHDERSKN